MLPLAGILGRYAASVSLKRFPGLARSVFQSAAKQADNVPKSSVQNLTTSAAKTQKNTANFAKAASDEKPVNYAARQAKKPIGNNAKATSKTTDNAAEKTASSSATQSDTIATQTLIAQQAAKKEGSNIYTKMLIASGLTFAAVPAVSYAELLSKGKLSEVVVENATGILGPEAVAFMIDGAKFTSSLDERAEASALLTVLKSTDKFDNEYLQTEEAQKLALATTYALDGQEVKATAVVADLGIKYEDVASAYETARKNNPNADETEIAAIALTDLKDKVHLHKLAQKRKNDDAKADTGSNSKPATTHPPSAGAVFDEATGAVRYTVDTLNNKENISEAFNYAVNKSGGMGWLMEGVAFVLDLFMDKQEAQKVALGMAGAKVQHNAILEALSNDKVKSRTGSSLLPKAATKQDLDLNPHLDNG